MFTSRRLFAPPPPFSPRNHPKVGYHVGEVVGRRLGRTILELGGNNAIIVTPSANLDLALRAILFGAVGTAGQRCTSTRRIIVHASVRRPRVACFRVLLRMFAGVRTF